MVAYEQNPDKAALKSIPKAQNELTNKEQANFYKSLDKQIFLAYNCKYFLTLQFSCTFWVLKRTVSLRRFFEYQKHMFWLRKKKNYF